MSLRCDGDFEGNVFLLVWCIGRLAYEYLLDILDTPVFYSGTA